MSLSRPSHHLPGPGGFRTPTLSPPKDFPSQDFSIPRLFILPVISHPDSFTAQQIPMQNISHQHEAFLNPMRSHPKDFPSLGFLFQLFPTPMNLTHPIQDFPSQ